MFRTILFLILFSATNAAAQNSCSPSTWDMASQAYQKGQAKHAQMITHYKKVCRTNPQCIHYTTKDREIRELRSMKNKALKQYQTAATTFEWFTENCGFKYKYGAKSKLASVNSDMNKIRKEFAEMESDCLRISNKIAKSFKCK